MVRTAMIGYLPTEVSPDSITASAPSSTAFATSEASARVGRECSIIESSIWVATMTGLAFSRAICTARFCTSGTCSSGSSTPRSPRATMIPSNASTMASRLATASGFSSLAMTGRRWIPTSSITWCTRSTSPGDADERQRDEVDAQRQGELQVGDVLLGHRRHRHVHPGQRDALVVRDRAALGDRAQHVVAGDLGDDQPDLAVVDQQPVTGPGVLGQARGRWWTPGSWCRRCRRR